MHRFHFDDSNWNFDDLGNMVTPTEDTNDNLITPTEEANDTTDPNTSEEDTGNSSVSSSISFDDQSSCSDNSTIENETIKHDGNVLLNLKQLDEAIALIACCKHCAERNSVLSVEKFVAFCKWERQTILNTGKSLPFRDEIELLQNKMNVSTFYQKWKKRQQKQIITVPNQC